MKILFVGIGGVGGFFGGQLAKRYNDHGDVEILFLARGPHLEQIQKNGLTINHLEESYTVHPDKASDRPSDFGICDYIFICTKNYSVNDIAASLHPCMGKNTKVITLLNGVGSVEVLRQHFLHNEVLNGCVYILSKIQEPGVIHNFGNIQKMFFGRDHQSVDDLKELESALIDAGVDFTLSQAISEVTWAKFVFISAVGTATSYYNLGLGEIIANESYHQVLTQLLEEVSALGIKKGVKLKNTIVADVLGKLERLPYDTTSSMQRDFQNGNKTELEALTGYVVFQSREMGIAAPTYERLYSELS